MTSILVKEKVLDNRMDKLNKYYYHVLCVNTFVYFINILLTVKMMNDSYYNNSTLSCFISFVLLVLMKLYNSMTVAYQSVKNDKMMSAYMSEFVSFNVLDTDYVNEKYNGKKNNRLEDIIDEEDSEFKDVKEEEVIEEGTLKPEDIKLNEEILPINQ